ncbi:long-chain fatty acid transport protein 4-like [Bacillus rossius redtenbacheri]|uniref:long-chain fatty acid transport protein 4-like n=1 Tax=Bacillus rossius redtenbacheri TaxID=93214 RepID=UPI002FDD4F3C
MQKRGGVLLLLAGVVSAVAAGVSPCQLALLAASGFALARCWPRVYVGLATLPRDLRLMYGFLAILIGSKRYQRNNDTVVTLFRSQVQKHPQKPCLLFEDQVWTFAQVEEFSNQVANVFLTRGHRKGDVVAVLAASSPRYVCVWLGLAKAGCVASLVNSNLRGDSLLHGLQAAAPRSLVFGAELAPVVFQVLPAMSQLPQLYQLGASVTGCGSDLGQVFSMDSLVEAAPSSQPQVEQLNSEDKMLYIFTSGTTGLPKPAIIPHSRFLLVCLAAKHMLKLRPDDVLYNPLPLYHSGGGIVGVGPTLVFGLQTVIRARFSASAYFSDCHKYHCTVGQYIGEMCRYILASPPRSDDTQHRVRLMVGNGMRPSIWRLFVERFQVPQICELYAATEGNTNMVNTDNTVGAVGFLPRCLPKCVFPVALVRVDPETGEPTRNERGLCTRCDVDEPGMYVGLISDSTPLRQFHGYVDKAASEKKIVRDVFRKGDKAFMSGDILVMDKYGYLYFKDRTGDTYRWKGENVSTAEVEAVMSKLIGLRDVAVYGVEVPGNEGRAGMATVVHDGPLDLERLATSLAEALPAYARPLFVRVTDKLDLTETFKIKKTALQREGFNPHTTSDSVYFRSGNTFVPLTHQLYRDITSRAVRV